MQLTAKTKGACIVLALLAIGGIAAWIYQLNGGLAVTGMSNVTSWGLYITMFMFFVGLSAGGLIVASSAHVFNIEAFKKISLPAVILSTVCICLAGMFILIDLGGIQRIWRIITGANFASPLVWDMCIILVYLVINILDIVWMRRGAESKVRKLSYVALPVAILVHSVTAWIFGLEAAKEGWNSAIMAPIFVASALDSGLALLIVALMGLKKAKIMEVEDGLFGKLGKLLATFVAVDAFLILCEVLTMGYSGGDTAQAILREMTAGATAPYFWFEIVCGLLVPFILLASAKLREKRGVLLFAAILVVLGVFCKRAWLLFSSFIPVNVAGGPGVTLGTTAAATGTAQDVFALAGCYAPTGIEIAIVCGVIALGALAFVLMSQKLLKKAE